MKTAEDFERATGFPPQNDDLHRINCDRAGRFGHWGCGWCPEHDKPRFVCGDFMNGSKIVPKPPCEHTFKIFSGTTVQKRLHRKLYEWICSECGHIGADDLPDIKRPAIDSIGFNTTFEKFHPDHKTWIDKAAEATASDIIDQLTESTQASLRHLNTLAGMGDKEKWFAAGTAKGLSIKLAEFAEANMPKPEKKKS